MSEPYAVLNALAPEEARRALTRCCGSSRWVEAMLRRRPFPSTDALHADADAIWSTLGRDDFLEAFAHHPRIGGDEPGAGESAAGDPREQARTLPRAAALRATAAWSRDEQARVAQADETTLRALRVANRVYLDHFGFIFIVCATGKSAAEMLGLLEARIDNDPERELAIAAGEQARITRLRLQKLAS
jgi:2-oxo-4-hydroxy-4-carboxy-5-ureidoimidazoline decarboxylase